VSSAIPYLPTALGASKATLLLGNNPSSGPYAWQLPQCNITSNPYSGSNGAGHTGPTSLFNCVAIQNGAISAVVWFYLPPGGQGAILGFSSTLPSSSPPGYTPWLYITNNGTLYGGDYAGLYPQFLQVQQSINPGWHMAVLEEYAGSYTGPYYVALWLDHSYIGQTSTTAFPQLFAGSTYFQYATIGAGYSCSWPNAPCSWFFFNGAIAYVALYNRVLTTGDVLAIYQGNLVTSGLVAVWYGDDYNSGNGYWISRVGGYTGAPVTSSYPPRGCILWNSALYSGPTGIWSSWQQC